MLSFLLIGLIVIDGICWWIKTNPAIPCIRYEQRQNKGKPAKANIMILSISIYLVNSLSHVPLPGNGARNACWHFLASLLTKLSFLAWCQKCIVGNYENTCKLYIYKVSASAQIIYHYSISPGSIPSIVIYILSTGRSYGIVDIEILTNMYTYDKTTLMLWQG